MNKDSLDAQAESAPIKSKCLVWDQSFSLGFSFDFSLSRMFLSYAFPSICTLGARRMRTSQRHPSSVEQSFHSDLIEGHILGFPTGIRGPTL